MHDTRTQTGTRHCKTNNRHSNSILTANQINVDNSERSTHLQQRAMDDNDNNRPNPDRFTHDSRLNNHWATDDDIMRIVNRRDNSPETRELFEGKSELTRSGYMRYQWHK